MCQYKLQRNLPILNVAGGARIRRGRAEDAVGELKATFVEERRDSAGTPLDFLMMMMVLEGDKIQHSGCSKAQT